MDAYSCTCTKACSFCPFATQEEFKRWHTGIKCSVSPSGQDGGILCGDRGEDPDTREEWAKYLRFHGGSIPRGNRLGGTFGPVVARVVQPPRVSFALW